MLASLSEVNPGFFNIILAIFLPALTNVSPLFVEKLLETSADIVRPLSVSEFYLLQFEPLLINVLRSVKIVSPAVIVIAEKCLSPMQGEFSSKFENHFSSPIAIVI